MKAELVNINKVRTNPNNPRIIKDEKFAKLVKSIQEFPQMLEIRPIVVNDDMIVLGGNMRLKACLEAGLKEIPIIKASNLTKEQQKEFIIKDNVGFGEWDWNDLANNWETEKLQEWGLDIAGLEEEDIKQKDNTKTEANKCPNCGIEIVSK
jgi:ParB-like chromosome segregation protein Spo0J